MIRLCQGVIVICGIAIVVVMVGSYQQQLDRTIIRFEQQARQQTDEIKVEFGLKLEVINAQVSNISPIIGRQIEQSNTQRLELELLQQSRIDGHFNKVIDELKLTSSLQDLLVMQKQGGSSVTYSLLTGHVKNLNVVNFQKHYEWIAENQSSDSDNNKLSIVSASSNRSGRHAYFSVPLLTNVKNMMTVMVTAVFDIRQFQQYLPDNYYLRLDGHRYLSTSAPHLPDYSAPAELEYQEIIKAIGESSLWGEWVIGTINGNDHYLVSGLAESKKNMSANVTMVALFTLLALIVLEYLMRSRRILTEKYQGLEDEIEKNKLALVASIENSRAISEDLVDSKLKLHGIIDASADGIIVCNEYGVVKSANLALKALLGYRDGEVVGKKIGFIFPEFAGKTERGEHALLDGVKANSEPQLVKTNAISKENRFITVELHVSRARVGHHEVWSIVIHDISEQIKDKDEIRDAQENLRAVIDNIAEGVITSDSTGIIQSFNPAAEKIFGRESQEMMGKNVSALMTGDDKERHASHLLRYLDIGKRNILGVGPREVIGVRRGGDIFHMEISTSEMVIGKKRMFIAIVRDISERKMVEKNMHMSYSELESLVDSHTDDLKKVNRELVKARDEALVAARSKAEFLAMMSHEIRTPINGVLGMLSLVRDTSLNEEQRDHVETAYTSGEALLALLNDVLDLSKIDAGRMYIDNSDFDIHQMLNEAVYVTSKMLHGSEVEITYDIADDVPRYVSGDVVRLRQILSNLIGNSIKFTQQGSILVSLSIESCSGKNCTLKFDVADTGIGIDDADVDRIFEEFSQADNSSKRNYGGTGLGLAICKRLVTLMGGAISVKSELGCGSTFSFSACFKTSKQEGSSAKSDDAGKTSTRKKTVNKELSGISVLVAEDNIVNQKVVISMLKKIGVKVDIVQNGQEALDILSKPDHGYRLVLMDCQMPEMDGYVATRQLRLAEKEHEGRVRTPVIAMTAHALPGDRDKCLDAGMDDYISKPISIDVVKEIIERWL